MYSPVRVFNLMLLFTFLPLPVTVNFMYDSLDKSSMEFSIVKKTSTYIYMYKWTELDNIDNENPIPYKHNE
jgi:hypothetical protein